MNLRGLAPAAYAKAYRAGWAASGRFGLGGRYDLGAAEARFLERNGYDPKRHGAFEDGWLDRAAGREKYHLRDHGPDCRDGH